MKRIILSIALALLMLSLSSVNSWANSQTQSSSGPPPNYSISIAGPVSPIKLGSPVKVVVDVTNTSQREVYWQSELGKDTAYRMFKFTLTKDGHEVETTYFHRRISGRQRASDPDDIPGSGSSVLLAHPPGKMFEIPIDVNRLYQITGPGEYEFRVCRPEATNKLPVCSKEFSLKIEK